MSEQTPAEPWTGDGSEEPPPYVNNLLDRTGEQLVRAGDAWDTPGGDALLWNPMWVEYGPFTEVV